jgi:hypothetical protein
MNLYKYLESLKLDSFDDEYYYMIGTEDDYKKIKDYYNLLNLDEIKKIKNNPLLKKYPNVYHKLGIVNTRSLIHLDDILLPKNVNPPYLILLKEKSFESYKKYKNIDDLVNDPNVAIYFQDNYQKNVYCYNLKNFTPLFFANLSKQSRNAYDSWSISRSVSDTEVAGKSILYPIMTYFAGGVISSSRDSVKEAARYVWKDFYDDSSNKVKKYFPIDDMDFTITASEEDDGVVFISTRYKYSKILSILKEEINKMDIKDQKIFNELLLIKNKNDMKAILDSYPESEINKKLKSFLNARKDINFKDNFFCERKDFIYILLSFITKKLYDQLEAIEVLEKIQESFLNWTYELKDNSIISKIKTLIKRHEDNFNNDSQTKKQIVKNAEILWDERYLI